ncbi:FAD-dependent oxidoreductase [Leifsonia flava]|uniref:FAD-dependent monooxygenase n=1 Tax=Orlajensenia leifsoniae TaxID=2561933 RepID=A0A4Y9R5Q2_9MICO|nr:NAD(P)/FAD-dependent oxidoreductase [Leifsonia flava]TFV99670.1 FAD-dependent monooxygenase [Leifsonia flava]
MPDVVLVGGGPVGLLLAILLAQRHVDVAVLEARTEGSAHSRAIGIHPPAVRVLEAAGIAAEAIGRGVPITHGEVLCDGRVLGSLDFAEAGAAYPFVLSLPQRETEALLRDRLKELAPDAVRRGARVMGVRQHGAGADVLLEDGSSVSASFVVGADGTRSAVRAASGIGWSPRGDRVDYVMADFPDDTGHPERALLFFERGGVVESFPLPQGERRWVAMTDREWTGVTSAELAELIAERTGMRSEPGTGVVSTFSVRQHLASRMVSGRVVLVGDAAHEISPIGGQGMNLGWLDAQMLAPAIEAALQGDHSGLDHYDRSRRHSAAIASRQAAFNMGMGKPVAGVRLRARNALVRSLAVPPTRALVARAFTMRWL